MTPGELEWLAKSGIASVDRYRFNWTSIGTYGSKTEGNWSGLTVSGSLLFVSSNTWRSHHRPEVCLEVYGLSVDHSYTTLVSPGFPVRALVLKDDPGGEAVSAAYWMQSSDQITDDYAERIWADLAPQRQRWVLVTVLFDGIQDPGSEEVGEFFLSLRSTIGRFLEGENQP